MSKTVKALKAPIYRPRDWGTPPSVRSLPRPWYGLDTERNVLKPHKPGEFVCGWIVRDDGFSYRFRGFDSVPAGTHFVWNLGYDIDGLLRDARLDEGWAAKEDATPFRLGNARCVYFHGKRFEYSTPGTQRLFIEASSFFGRIPLKEAVKALCKCPCAACLDGEAHCGKEPACPTKDPADASQMSLARYRKDARYRAMIDKYCIKDARLALQLIEYLNTGLAQLKPPIVMGGTPGTVARRLIAQLPAFPNVIWQTQRAFLNAYCGGKFEAVKQGYFERAQKFDIVSAYPWALSESPWLTKTAYHRAVTRMTDSALYGAYLVSFKCDAYFGIAPQWRGTTRVYSTSERKAWISRPELQLIQEWGGDYRVLKGVEIFDENADDSWRRLIAPPFKMRQAHKKEPVGLGAKIALNSVVGGLIQLQPRGGKWVPIGDAVNPVDFAGTLALEMGEVAFEGGRYYAPCYAGNVTSLVRVKILKTARALGEDNAIATHTDSLFVVKGKPTISKELGGWAIEGEDEELIMLKTGQYVYGGETAARGIGRRVAPEVLLQETYTRRSRISVKSAHGDWDLVSNIVPKETQNNLGGDLKRAWDRMLTRKMVMQREFGDSRPLRDIGSNLKAGFVED